MVIYIYGEDTFSSRQYLAQQIERFKKERDPQGFNVVFVDGQKNTATIWNEVVAAPFLAEKKLVVVQNMLSSKDVDSLEVFAEKIDQNALPEKNVIIFWQGEALGKTKIIQKIHAALAKEKWAKEFLPPTGSALNVWIKNEAGRCGGLISSAAVQYLVQHAGDDMWKLSALVKQLVTYAAEREVSLADAQLFLDEKTDDNIFNMVDAIVAGNKKMAFTLLEAQRQLGEDESYIFSMILRQFRILVSMRDVYEMRQSISSGDMAAELNIHPFVAKKSLPLIKKYSLDSLKYIYNTLLDIDVKTKTGLADQSWLIDIFVGKLSS